MNALFLGRWESRTRRALRGKKTHWPHKLLRQRCKVFSDKDFYLKPGEIARKADIPFTDLHIEGYQGMPPCLHHWAFYQLLSQMGYNQYFCGNTDFGYMQLPWQHTSKVFWVAQIAIGGTGPFQKGCAMSSVASSGSRRCIKGSLRVHRRSIKIHW